MAAKQEYIFNRDAAASARLNLQHYLWIASTGYLLHPSIPVPENAVVADIGTGTGIFSLELARTLPTSTRIEAYDISLAQSAPTGWCPANMQLGELDILAPIPAALQGRFDVVHVRLFMCVVPQGDPRPLLVNLLALLKPGGYLQWQEYDSTTDRVATAAPGLRAPKLQALLDWLHAQNPHLEWTRDLHAEFARHGAELVEEAKHRTPDSHQLLKQDVTFLAIREWAASLMQKDPAQAKKILDSAAEVEEECWALRRGSVVDSEYITWVAKKL